MIIVERVKSGLKRAKAQGKRLAGRATTIPLWSPTSNGSEPRA
jgi:hypothetical protein